MADQQQKVNIEIGIDENGKQLSLEEVWDDSALVDSWEEAVEEYKRYHSIDAKKEDKAAIIQAALEDAGHAPKPKIIGPVKPTEMMETSKLAKEKEEEEYVPPEDITLEDASEEYEEAVMEHAKNIVVPEIPEEMLQRQAEEMEPVAEASSQPGPSAGVPEMLAQATAGNEELKNLMMAWYWAGYYTGLHEGQKRAAGGAPNS